MGWLTVVINAAGVAAEDKPEDATDPVLDRMIAVKLTGWTRTAIAEREMRDAALAAGTAVEDEFALLSQRIALRRVARPAAMAASIGFLASDEATSVTDPVRVANGGSRVSTQARDF